MHFFYLDESGDTGRNLDDPNQPVFVLGGISVRDKGWNKSQKMLDELFLSFFDGEIPENFELHADDLLSPNGDGDFEGVDPAKRYGLAMDVLKILHERSHGVHYLAIDKAKLRDAPPLNMVLSYNPRRPYLISFDFLITYIHWFVKEKLGQSARGMIILDQKENYHNDIERIMRDRRYSGPNAHRLKWIVEFSYPIDSKKNPMIQFSDLVIYCIRRFIELENGYRDNWSQEAKDFYANCYATIRERVAKTTLVERQGRGRDRLNEFFSQVRVEPRRRWKRHYNIEG